MKCPKCQTENPKGAKFCGECAEPLPPELACPQCGHMNPKGQKFCNDCAHPLDKPAAPPTEQSSNYLSVIGLTVAGLVLALIAFEIAALILWVPGTWNERLTAVLAIVGMYGLAIGFFSRSAALTDFKDVLKDLTSSNILLYTSAQFSFIAFLAFLLSVAISPKKTQGYPTVLGIIGSLLLFLLLPILFLYWVFHLLVVAMLSYIPIVLASAIVAEFVYAAEDIKIKLGSNEVIVSDIVKKDPLATKGFLIGIPALLVSVLSAIGGPFIT